MAHCATNQSIRRAGLDAAGQRRHCLLLRTVTRREIQNALQGPLPAKSLGGLKRRTRVTMGRCQGFYCSAELSEITANHLEPPMAAACRW